MVLSIPSRLLVFSLLLILSGCGGSGDKIDATNADTLRTSLNAIAASMSEAERQSFGQDVLLVFEHSTRGTEGIGGQSLFSNDYAILFNAEPNAATVFAPVFQEIALNAGDALDGKSPRDLSTDANTIRSEVLTTYRDELEGVNGALQEMLEGIPATISERQSAHASALARQAEIERQKATALDNISVTSFELNNRLQAVFAGTADITNFTDLTVTNIRYILEMELPSIPGYAFTGTQTLAIDPPLAPGETLTGYAIDFSTSAPTTIRQQQDATRVQLGQYLGPLETAAPESELVFYATLDADGNASRQSLNLSLEEQNVLRGHDDRIEKCEASAARLIEAIAENNALIAEVAAAIDSPKPLSRRPARVTFFGGAC